MAEPDPVSEGYPVLVFCPYLELSDSYEFAGWWIGPLESYEGTWDPPRLRQAAGELLSRFVDVNRKPIDRPTLVAPVDGIIGRPPPDIESLGLAIALGALVRNPHGPQDDEDRQSWRVITTDNTGLWVQPVDLEHRRISIERGFWVRILAGGYRFDDPEFSVPPPLELHIGGRCLFDQETAAASYRILHAPDETTDEDLARRLRQTIRWWLQSWLNSISLTWDDRVVQLRIAVDALVGSDNTAKAIEWFAALFASLSDDERGDELLWNKDHPQFDRTHNGKTHQLPAFEHWFRSFADRRNEIVHEGVAATQIYDESTSPYAGNYLEVAERVVLEAILVTMHQLIPGHYWRSPMWRAISDAFKSSAEDGDSA